MFKDSPVKPLQSRLCPLPSPPHQRLVLRILNLARFFTAPPAPLPPPPPLPFLYLTKVWHFFTEVCVCCSACCL